MTPFVSFDCPVHGHQLDTVPQATVRCRSCRRWLTAPGVPRRATVRRREGSPPGSRPILEVTPPAAELLLRAS